MAWLLILLLAGNLVDDLKSDDETTRMKAAADVRKLGPGAVPIARELGRTLEQGTVRDRIAAARGLEALETHARAALPALVDATATANSEVRVAALRALAAIGPGAAEAADALAASLTAKEARVRVNAAFALMKLQESARPAEAALAKALTDSERLVVLYSTYALTNFQAEQPATMNALVKQLRTSPDAGLRTAAAIGLRKMGPHAKGAAPALIAALKDSHYYVRERSAYALVAIGLPASKLKKALRPLFADESWHVRCSVCMAARQFGKEGRALRAELEAATTDRHAKVALEAYTSLEELFPNNQAYSDGQNQAHKDYYEMIDAEDRRKVLARFGDDVDRAVRELTKQLRTGDDNHRALAAWALENLKADAEAAIPALAEALRDPDGDVRYAALAALEDIGQAPVLAMLHLLEDGYDQLRWNAQSMLRKRKAEIEALLKDPETEAAAQRALGLLRDKK